LSEGCRLMAFCLATVDGARVVDCQECSRTESLRLLQRVRLIELIEPKISVLHIPHSQQVSDQLNFSSQCTVCISLPCFILHSVLSFYCIFMFSYLASMATYNVLRVHSGLEPGRIYSTSSKMSACSGLEMGLIYVFFLAWSWALYIYVFKDVCLFWPGDGPYLRVLSGLELGRI